MNESDPRSNVHYLGSSLNFFRPYFHYCLSSAHYCEDHFHFTFDDFVDNKDVAAEGFVCTNLFFFDPLYPNISTHILHNIL